MIQEELETAPPADWVHTQTIYNLMRANAVEQVLADQSTALVYEGYYTSLFVEAEMPMPYYTKVTRLLKTMGCIRQLRRGGGAAMSQWEVLDPPNLQDFEVALRLVEARNPTKSKTASNTQSILDLTERVTFLEDGFQKLLQALRKDSDG